jgi:hypothetical protein
MMTDLDRANKARRWSAQLYRVPTELRGLVGQQGYRPEKAPNRGCWFLVDEKTGEHVAGDRGTTASGVEAAIKFLAKYRS